jgi:hypothetical protein
MRGIMMVRRRRKVIAQGVVVRVERVSDELSFAHINNFERGLIRVPLYMQVTKDFEGSNVDVVQERKGLFGGILAQEISSAGMTWQSEVSYAWVLGINRHYGIR